MNNPIKTTAALIIDIENLIGGFIKNELDYAGQEATKFRILNFDIGPVCEAVIHLYGSLNFRFSIGDIFYSCKRTNNLDLNIHIKKNFHEHFIDVLEVSNFDNVKDCSDFVIYTKTLDLAYREPSIGSFVIFSMDKGFIPLYIKLKQLGKMVTVVGMSEVSTPEQLSHVADNVIYYNDLAEPGKNGIFYPADSFIKEGPAPSNRLTLIEPAPIAIPKAEPNPVSTGPALPPRVPSGKSVQGPEPPPPVIITQTAGITLPEGRPGGKSTNPADPQLPSWVNFDNYEIAEKISKSVEKVLRCPVLSRDHYASICQLVETTFLDLTRHGASIRMVPLTELVTSIILESRANITAADLQEYNIEYLSLDKLASKLVYKVLRTLYMSDVFTRLPNENNKCNDPTLTSFVETKPELLTHLFSAFFGYLKKDNLPLEPEPLAMAFYRTPTEDSREEMREFIRKYKTYRAIYFTQTSRPQPFEILSALKG